MKPQDLIFLVTILTLLFFRNPKYLVLAGLFSFVLSIPLFTLQIFFTAQRLTMYGAAFILFAIIFILLNKDLEK